MKKQTTKSMIFLLFSCMAFTLMPAAAAPEHKNQKMNLDIHFANAVLEGKISQAQELLHYKADIEMRDSEEKTLLQKACESNNVKTIRALLQLKANVNSADYEGNTPLLAAVSNRHIDIVDLLLNVHADPNLMDYDNYSALNCAVIADDLNIMQRLIQADACIDQRLRDNSTSLMWAVEAGNINATKLLLEAKADPLLSDQDDWTALQIAQREHKPNPELEQILIQKIEQHNEEILSKTVAASPEQKKSEKRNHSDEITDYEYVEALIGNILVLDIDNFEKNINTLCYNKKLNSKELSIYLQQKKGLSGDTIFDRFEKFRQCLNKEIYNRSIHDLNNQDVQQLLFLAQYFQTLGMKPVMPKRFK